MKSSSKDWIFIGQECGSKWIKLLLKMSHNLQLWTKFPRGQAWKASDLCPPSPRAGTDNARKKNNCQPAGQGAWSRLYMVFSAGLLAIMAPGLEPSRAMTQYVLKCWEWLQPFIFFLTSLQWGAGCADLAIWTPICIVRLDSSYLQHLLRQTFCTMWEVIVKLFYRWVNKIK